MLSRWIAAVAALTTPAVAGAQVNWSGFYVGAEAGGSDARLRVSGTDNIFQLSNEHPAPPGSPNNPLIVVPGTSRDYAGSHSQLSFLYGGFVGAQWQVGMVVLGVEGDIHGSRNASSFSTTQAIPSTLLAPPSTLTQTRDVRIRYDWSARARIGIAAGQSLLYATGGIAQTNIRLTGTDSFTTPAGAAAPEIPPNSDLSVAGDRAGRDQLHPQRPADRLDRGHRRRASDRAPHQPRPRRALS